MISQAIRTAAAALLIGIFAWTAAAAFPAEFEPGNTAPSAKVPPVQLFDMQQERIIKTIPNQEEHQAAAREWLQSVTGLAPQMTLDSRCGYIVRIPPEAPVEIAAGAIEDERCFLNLLSGQRSVAPGLLRAAQAVPAAYFVEREAVHAEVARSGLPAASNAFQQLTLGTAASFHRIKEVYTLPEKHVKLSLIFALGDICVWSE